MFNWRMMRATAFSIVLFAASSVSAQGRARNPLPPLPWERPAPCDTYCEPLWTVCRPIPVRAAGDSGAPTLFTLTRGDTIHVTAGKIRVERPGIVLLRGRLRYERPEGFSGPEELPASAPDTVTFQVGDTVFVLDWDSDGDASGAWHVWYRGHHLAVEKFWSERGRYSSVGTAELLSRPVSTWWVQVRDTRGRAGWLAVADDNVAGKAPHYEDGPERCAKQG